jgi:hypothetical protein
MRVGETMCVEAGAARTLELVSQHCRNVAVSDISEFRKAEGSLPVSASFSATRRRNQSIRTLIKIRRSRMQSEHAGYAARAAHRAPEMGTPETVITHKPGERFAGLVRTPDLDEYVETRPLPVRMFEHALREALAVAYDDRANAVSSPASAAAHLFLQRTLYRINRLKFFWYDGLANYDNERSAYLRETRDRIEAAWQSWELAQLNIDTLRDEDVAAALQRRAAEDLSPAPSAGGLYFRDEVGELVIVACSPSPLSMDWSKPASSRARSAE